MQNLNLLLGLLYCLFSVSLLESRQEEEKAMSIFMFGANLPSRNSNFGEIRQIALLSGLMGRNLYGFGMSVRT